MTEIRFRLNHPQPCPSCGKKNENKWCYEMYSSGDVLLACKRENELNNNIKYENTGNTDSEGTPLYREIPGRLISTQGKETFIYYSHSTPKTQLVKVLRRNSGDGEKTFTQYGLVDNEWVSGLSRIDKSDISLYNIELLNSSHNNTVFLCEGEKVADSVTDFGLLGITNLGGANKWKDYYTTILKDLEVKVVLVPDCDQPGIKSMKTIESKLSEAGIKTSWLLPFDGNKMWDNPPKSHGLDFVDWIKYIERFDINADILRQFIKNDFAYKESGNNNSGNTYLKTKILNSLNDIFYKPTICVDDALFIWEGTHYKYVSPGKVRKIIWDYLETTPVERTINGKKMLVLDPNPADVDRLQSAAYSKFFIESSALHNGGINCKNGLLTIDWSDINNPKPVLLPHDPSQYYTYCSDVVYDPNAKTDQLDKLMECLDPKYANIFFQVIGVALDFRKVRELTGRTVRALLMSGFGSNGKDSLKTVLGLIIGNITDVSFQDFKEYDSGRKFPLTKLKNATVNWASENSSVNLATIQSIKSAITGETLSYEKKGRNEEMMSCNAINLFNVNSLPQINNMDALLTRFAEIRFSKTYAARPKAGELQADPKFRYDFKFLTKEVCPAFLNRMVEGLIATVKYGIDYSPTDHLIQKMKQKTNHLWSFADECGLVMGEGEVTTKEIWNKLEEWYIESDILEIDNMQRKVYFGGEKRKDPAVKCIAQVKPRFQELFPKVEVISRRNAKERVTIFKGLIFKNDGNNNPPDNDNNPPDNYNKPPNNPLSPNNEESVVKEAPPEPIKSNIEDNIVEKPINYPYNLTKLVKGKNFVDVDESGIDIYHTNKSNYGEFTPFNLPDYETLNILYFDIETTGLDPESSEVIAIGVSDGKDNWLMTRENQSEKELLIEFLQLVKEKSDELILVGHNIFSFDIPFIYQRALANDIRLNMKFSDRPSFITSSSVNGKPIEYTPIYWINVQFVDTYHMLGLFDKSANKLNSYSLKRSVLQLKLRKEERLELGYKEILGEYEENKWDNILEYLVYDLEDTKLLCDFLLPQIYYQLKVVPNTNLQKLVVASPALKWELILENYYDYYDKKPDADIKSQYLGGLVDVNPGYYDQCGKIDVSGMYPSIQLLYGLSSSKDTDKFYLTVLNYLMKERMVLKNKFKETKEPKYDAMQNAYKILNNGGYGFTGTSGYPFNCMQTSALVTAYGRVIVSKMVEKMEELGCKIIEVDTDGIYYSHPDQKKIYEEVQAVLPDGIKIDLEYEGVSIYCPAKKNYIIFDDEGYIIKGGNFKSRTKCNLLKNFTLDYLLSYRKSPEEAETYYEQVINSLNSGDYNLEELIIRQRIPANSKALLSLGDVGDVVSYYWGGSITKRGAIKKEPVQSGDYLAKHYINEVNKLKENIIKVI